MKKFLFSILMMLSFNVFAFSIPITSGIINSQISDSFPQTVQKVELSDPRVILKEDKAIICLTGLPKIFLLDKKFQFCASFKPVWNAQLTQLEAKDLELLGFDMDGIGKVNNTLRLVLNNEVLPHIKPIKIYKSDSWISKQVSDIEIEKSVMYIKF